MNNDLLSPTKIEDDDLRLLKKQNSLESLGMESNFNKNMIN